MCFSGYDSILETIVLSNNTTWIPPVVEEA
jgi:hypothetical protein